MNSSTAGARLTRRKAALALTFATLICNSAAFAQAPSIGTSIEGLLDYARNTNPAFAAERHEASAARERVGAAGALPDPNFQLELMDFTNTMRGGNTSLVPGEVGQTRYRITQPLPGWGKRDLQSRIANAKAEQSTGTRDAMWLDVANNVKTSWLRYYAADRETMLAREALTLLEGLEATTLARYRLGLVPQQVVLRAQREITRQRLSLVMLEQRRSAAVAALNGLLAREPSAPLDAPGTLPAAPDALQISTLLERARAANPLLMAGDQAVDAARLERDLTYRDRYPDFAVGLTNNRPRAGTESWDLMFEVSIPLQQGVRRSRERESERMIDAAAARRAAAEAQLLAEIGSAHSGFVGGQDTLRLIRGTLLPQATATRDAARAGFETGRVDFDAVLESERQLVDTRLAMLQAEIETRMAIFELEKLVGENL